MGNPTDAEDTFVAVFDMVFTGLNYGAPISELRLLSSDLPGTVGFSFGPDSIEVHLPTGSVIAANTIYTATLQVIAIPEASVLALSTVGLCSLAWRRERT